MTHQTGLVVLEPYEWYS